MLIHTPCRARGFTLVELLIALVVLALLLTVAVPGFQRLIQNQRTSATAHELFQALQLTRQEAVQANNRATLRPLGNWQQGWEVFQDPQHSGQPPGAGALLHRAEPAEGVLVHANRPLRSHVSYIGTGESRRTGHGLRHRGAFQAGTFTVCPEEISGRGYQLVLARGGRVRMERIEADECGEYQ